MFSEFKIDTSILVDDSIIETFHNVQKYAACHEDEVEEAGRLSFIEWNFNEVELAIIGKLVLSGMLLNK